MASSSNNAVFEYLESFPPGFRFKPTDIELITCYLNPKNNGGYLPPNMIHEASLYEGEGPEQLTNEKYFFVGEGKIKEWYFFTRREKKYVNGERPKRAAGSGYWKATGTNVTVYNKGEGIGKKRNLKFYIGKPPNGVSTSWLMQEYQYQPPKTNVDDENNKKSKKSKPSTCDTSIQVSQSKSKNPMLDGYVLCRVYNKDHKIKDQALDAEQEQQLGVMQEEEEQQEAPIMPDEEHQQTEQHQAECHRQGPIAQTEDHVLPYITYYSNEQHQQHVPTHALNHEHNSYNTPSIASNNFQKFQFSQHNQTYIPQQEHALDHDTVDMWFNVATQPTLMTSTDEATMQQPLLLPSIEQEYDSNDTFMSWMAGTHASSSSKQPEYPTRRWPGPSVTYSAISVCDELSTIFKK